MKNMLARTFALTAILAVSGTVNAGLMLEVTDAGGGQTLWTFSGSDTIASGGPTSRNGFWFDEGNTSGFDSLVYFGALNPTANTFSGDVAGTSLSLYDFFLRDTGFGVRTTPNPGWNNGDLIAWAGSFVLNVSLSNFATGVFTGTTIGTDGDFQTLTEGFEFRVDQAAVPLPAPLALIGLGLAGLGIWRKKPSN